MVWVQIPSREEHKFDSSKKQLVLLVEKIEVPGELLFLISNP
jgi:hypothetical protein